VQTLQAQQGALESQLPGLQAQDQAARDAVARANADAARAAGAVQQTQNNIADTRGKVNAGLGQQALDAVGQVESSLNEAQSQLGVAGQSMNDAESELNQAAGAYATALPELKATAAALFSRLDEVVPALDQKIGQQQHDLAAQADSLTLYRITVGALSMTILMLAALLWRKRGHTAPAAPQNPPAGPGAATEQLSDHDRLPSQPVEFIDDEDLGEYFS
jgi:hypothetical protein